MPLTSGTSIGPYEIVGWLGAGGMGEVYRARDPRLGRDVAIKLIPDTLASNPIRVRRFEEEARAAGQINHPNIVAVYDVGTHAGAPYIVSELLEGETLRSRVTRGALPPRKASEYGRQIAEGLAAAHEKGIVHRDLKPDNLFIATDGRIKILDFGIAKLTRPGEEAAPATGASTDTEPGIVMGTAGYMSPEQVRGEVVDARSDIFSFGAVLYEMLTGRPAFVRATSPETMAAILKEDPVEPLPAVSAGIARIVSRCLEKARESRFQSARDLAFSLEVLSGENATSGLVGAAQASGPWRQASAAAIVVLSLGAVVAAWLSRDNVSAPLENLLTGATMTMVTTFEGSKQDAAISPNGKFVSFIADHDGPFHVWLKSLDSGGPVNMTRGLPDQRNPGPNRHAGFSGDARIWINGSDRSGKRLQLVPLIGGAPSVFLREKAVNVAWSRDEKHLVYFTSEKGDPMYLADRDGGNERVLFVGNDGDHNHFPVWSTDGQWIFFACAIQSLTEYRVCRLRSSGQTGPPEQLTPQATDARYLSPIDARTLLYVAPDEDRSGPWLWALDVERKETHRVSTGLERYLSIAAADDGRRLVATVANATAGLWTVPILDRSAEERDASPLKPYPFATARALAPRLWKTSLFYLSSSGPGDGLWRFEAGSPPVVIWDGSKGALLESPAVSPRGDRAAIVVRRNGRQQLTLVRTDGSSHSPLAADIDVRGAAAWSPTAEWIVVGGSDGEGAGLFKIPVSGGKAFKLVSGPAFDPVWSPDGRLIVYTGKQAASAPLLAVRPDSSPVELPTISVPTGGSGRARFLPSPNRTALVYVQGLVGSQEFWLLDLTNDGQRDLTASKTIRLARLSSPAVINAFDITPDGTRIVFDRVKENSEIRLIELPKR